MEAVYGLGILLVGGVLAFAMLRPNNMPLNLRGKPVLIVAIGAITALALVWFVASFFVLRDESPRGSLDVPAYAMGGTSATGIVST